HKCIYTGAALLPAKKIITVFYAEKYHFHDLYNQNTNTKQHKQPQTSHEHRITTQKHKKIQIKRSSFL
ncbi:hypothetical protein, partial [Escherichia coli]|uniref:hypothetical protein n=1 Tax=Escherichia coli TaxID=562 RepID=UPI001BCD2AE3